MARAWVNRRDYERAVACAKASLRWRPTFSNAHFILAIARGHLERNEEAARPLAQCEAIEPGFVQRRADWQPYVDAASNAHLMVGLRRAQAAK